MGALRGLQFMQLVPPPASLQMHTMVIIPGPHSPSDSGCDDCIVRILRSDMLSPADAIVGSTFVLQDLP